MAKSKSADKPVDPDEAQTEAADAEPSGEVVTDQEPATPSTDVGVEEAAVTVVEQAAPPPAPRSQDGAGSVASSSQSIANLLRFRRRIRRKRS